MNEPAIVDPSQILANAQASATTARLADKLRVQITPPGTAPAKVRLGYVTAFDPSTWTCTALIGDLITPIPNIPVLGQVLPAIESAAMFLQTGGDSTTQYTCVGTMPKDAGTPTYGQTWRIRKTAQQQVSNSTVLQNDNDLKFYGQAGRTYIFEFCLLMSMNFTNNTTVDFKYGWALPSGATWSGGGPAPVVSSAVSADRQAVPSWKGFVNTTGNTEYGSIATNAGDVTVYPFSGTIKMGATSGLCTVVWSQFTAVSGTTFVNEGSYLKVDMTSEYTL